MENKKLYENCILCPRNCNTNRNDGNIGDCIRTLVDYGYVVALVGQYSGDGRTYLACARNDYLHTNLPDESKRLFLIEI